MTRTEESWAERVRAWRASGLSAERFAEGKGYAGSTLRYRASKLGASGKATPAGSVPRVTLRRVVRSSGARSGAALHVHVGGASIAVTAGFDPDLLRALVSCLAGATE